MTDSFPFGTNQEIFVKRYPPLGFQFLVVKLVRGEDNALPALVLHMDKLVELLVPE